VLAGRRAADRVVRLRREDIEPGGDPKIVKILPGQQIGGLKICLEQTVSERLDRRRDFCQLSVSRITEGADATNYELVLCARR
jgi:hypothetical protein